MYSLYTYPNSIREIIETQNRIQHMLNPISSIIERENQILRAVSLPNFNYINAVHEVLNNSPATYIRQTINNTKILHELPITTTILECATTLNNIQNLIQQPLLVAEYTNTINNVYNYASRHFAAIQNVTDVYNAIPQMLPFLNISTLNSYIQDVCSNMPNDVLIDFNETELNIIDKMKPLIEAFNKNIYTKIKIKILENKNKIGNIALFIVFTIILNYLGCFNVKDFLSTFYYNLLSSNFIDYIKSKNDK